MKSKFLIIVPVIIFILIALTHSAEARARYASFRVGGYNSHGKGSHYVGGYVRNSHTLEYYLKH